MDTNFGVMLRSFRGDRQLSQKKVAREAQLDDSYVSLLELNKRGSPSRAVVYSLASSLSLDEQERDLFLLSAGYTPHSLKSLLSEPLLADLDDVMSNVSGDTREMLVERIQHLISVGQNAIAAAHKENTG